MYKRQQQVLKLNAVDYLTKPVDHDQLVEVLKRAENLYKSERKTSEILNEKYPQIKRNYISKLMRENFQHMDDSFFEAFDINISNGYGIVAFIDLHYSEDIPYEMVQDNVEHYCEVLTNAFRGSFFFCMDNLQIFMIYTDSNSKEESDFFNKLGELELSVNQYASDTIPTSSNTNKVVITVPVAQTSNIFSARTRPIIQLQMCIRDRCPADAVWDHHEAVA